MDLLNNLSKKRELTFNKTGYEDDHDASVQLRRSQDLQIFAVNQITADGRVVSSSEDEDEDGNNQTSDDLKEEEAKMMIRKATLKKARIEKQET